MSVNTLPAPSSLNSVHYSISTIRDEARQLVEKGSVDRHQPIYVLCQYIPPREWLCVECELERCGYLLRDHICDLIPHEEWEND
jgi:hypothetical protein